MRFVFLPVSMRGQLGGDVRAALPGGLCELGERAVPVFDGDVADGEDTVEANDAQMIVNGDPSAAALWDVPPGDLVVDVHPAGPHHDVGGQETLIAEDHSVRAYLLDRRVEPQVHTAFFQ